MSLAKTGSPAFTARATFACPLSLSSLTYAVALKSRWMTTTRCRIMDGSGSPGMRENRPPCSSSRTNTKRGSTGGTKAPHSTIIFSPPVAVCRERPANVSVSLNSIGMGMLPMARAGEASTRSVAPCDFPPTLRILPVGPDPSSAVRKKCRNLHGELGAGVAIRYLVAARDGTTAVFSVDNDLLPYTTSGLAEGLADAERARPARHDRLLHPRGRPADLARHGAVA